MPDRSAALVTIEVVDGEYVAVRGARERVWFVRVNQGWVAAIEQATEIIQVDPGPGTVWERRLVLELPRDSVLLEVESAPRPVVRTPLEYLTKGPQTARRVRRREFRVGARGLVPLASAVTDKKT